ncbi:SulP family inorganic anion transporter [Chroococcidiopsis thermalis]|jgi:sulfate permease, SulP family|uniref:Sulfate transporter n=1 Tax=Chroococcidiopsis thermalis (strain PCC 7203) TaxID=251229 RepID=K9U2E1_CHRTP|nr:SulP family inorganic anion transporter [Chroococcidiopsis thermalis]AFY88404.1 sulfate transporter [Chroococcidiopsis thermalis PCC 7203]PSB49022.1 SulP family inorganic anion transporter [Cyanosarcina cf. burmensis CCALA 770]
MQLTNKIRFRKLQLTNKIHFRNLRGDIFGGVTNAIVSLPIALAFGVASGLGPVAGLYGSICVGFFASLFGGTPTQISEPTGPTTVFMTAIISAMIARNPENGMAMAFTVVMLSGVFQILFGVFRLGKYIILMPYSVVSGFMSGIGAILIILQIPPFLGHEAPKGGLIGTLQNLPQMLSNLNPAETGLAALTMVVIFFLPHRIKHFIPPQLAALVIGTIISFTLLQNMDLRRIGEIPSGLPTLYLPTFTPAQTVQMFVDAAMLGMLGSIDALLTSVIADSMTRTQTQEDRELVGQGVGNLVAGLCGGLPGSGATMGTVINVQVGARTALAGLIRAVLMLVVVLWLADLAENIPMAVLAGIAFAVGIEMLDWNFLKRAHKVSWKSTLIMYGVLLMTVFLDLMVAAGVGMFIANLLTIEQLSHLQAQRIKAVCGADDSVPLNLEEKELLNLADGRVSLFYMGGPMLFGVAKTIAREHLSIKRCDTLVMDLSDVPYLDETAALVIEAAIKDSQAKGSQVFIVGAVGKVKHLLESLGILNLVPYDNLFLDRTDALKQAVVVDVAEIGLDVAEIGLRTG